MTTRQGRTGGSNSTGTQKQRYGKQAKTNSSHANRTGKKIENILLTKVDLERAWNELRFIDQVVLCYRYVEGQQLDEIAQRLNRNQSVKKYSPDSVRMITNNALKKIRNKLGIKEEV